MTSHETINRDSRSYRHGLVLGLTLAEIMLLLVFILLITMAAIWRHERVERLKLPAPASSNLSDAAKQTVSRVVDAVKDTKPEDANRVIQAINQINNGKELEPLDKKEREFIAESRSQFCEAVLSRD
jgi:hypothetical protein